MDQKRFNFLADRPQQQQPPNSTTTTINNNKGKGKAYHESKQVRLRIPKPLSVEQRLAAKEQEVARLLDEARCKDASLGAMHAQLKEQQAATAAVKMQLQEERAAKAAADLNHAQQLAALNAEAQRKEERARAAETSLAASLAASRQQLQDAAGAMEAVQAQQQQHTAERLASSQHALDIAASRQAAAAELLQELQGYHAQAAATIAASKREPASVNGAPSKAAGVNAALQAELTAANRELYSTLLQAERCPVNKALQPEAQAAAQAATRLTLLSSRTATSTNASPDGAARTNGWGSTPASNTTPWGLSAAASATIPAAGWGNCAASNPNPWAGAGADTPPTSRGSSFAGITTSPASASLSSVLSDGDELSSSSTSGVTGQVLCLSSKVRARCLMADDSREVWVVQKEDGGEVVVKSWDLERLSQGNGGNCAQTTNKLRLGLSPLARSQDFVACLYINLSASDGSRSYFPHGGRSMQDVCAGLRASGNRPELYRMVRHMLAGILPALQDLKAQGLIHHDVKLENMLLGRDGKVRLADMGLLGDEGDLSSGGDLRFLPAEYAALYGRDGLQPADLAAANTWRLDVRGVGLAMLDAMAGCLPDEVTPVMMHAFAAPPDELQAFYDRVATHDWASSIDGLVGCPEDLKSLAKLCLGPIGSIPSLQVLADHEAITCVRAEVQEIERNCYESWQANITAASATVSHVEALLLTQAAQSGGGGSSSGEPLSLGDRFQLIHQQHRQVMLRQLQQQLAQQAALQAAAVQAAAAPGQRLGSSSDSAGSEPAVNSSSSDDSSSNDDNGGDDDGSVAGSA